MRKPFTHTDIPYGFRWGPLHVERVASDELTFGAVVEVGSDRDRFHVRVSPAGRRVQITQVMRGGKHNKITRNVLVEVPGDTLRGATLQGAYLHEADLSGADLSGQEADLRGANLSVADLREADLRDAKPIVVNTIGGRPLRIPLVVRATLERGLAKCWVGYDYAPLGIMAYGETADEAQAMFRDELEFLWREYALADDEALQPLHPSAQGVKRRLLNMVADTPPDADGPDTPHSHSMVLGDDGCLHDEPMQQRLVRRGVPVERLTERLAGCDTSERGTVAERQAQDAEVMGDLADARGAANAAEMEGAPEPERKTGLAAIVGKWPGDETDEEIEEALQALRESSPCPQCADLRQQLSDAHLSTETLRKTVDTLKRQHAGLQRHIQRLVSEPETPCPQCADLEAKCARIEQSRRDLRKRNKRLRKMMKAACGGANQRITELQAANAAAKREGAREALQEAITQQGMRTAEFHHEYSDDDPAYEANRALNALKRQAAALDAEEAD